MTIKKAVVSVAISLVMTLSSMPISANELSERLTDLLESHDLIQAAKQNIKSSEYQVGVERSGWFPELNVKLQGGLEDYQRNPGVDQTSDTYSATVSAKQLLWDFGALNAAIDKTQYGVSKASAELDKQRQYLMLAGLESEIDLYTATLRINFAKKSEQNIKNQTKLESARVDAGQGYATDLLQAKSQLASAEAKSIEAQGELIQAKNRYRAIFNSQKTTPVKRLDLPNIDAFIPLTLENSISQALDSQPDLVVSKANHDIAKADIIKVKKTEWMPKINLVLLYSYDDNPDGRDLNREQKNVGVDFNWNFNTGLKASKSVSAASHYANSVGDEYKNIKRQVIENTSNAWNQLQIAKRRAQSLSVQASITEEFLILARKERELGRRSLLDVLVAETSLLNAKSDTIAAESEIMKAKLNLLLQVAKLDLSLLNQ